MPRRRRGTSKLLEASMAYLSGVVKSLRVDAKLVLAQLVSLQCSVINITTNNAIELTQSASTQSTSSQRSLSTVPSSDHSSTGSSSQSRQSSTHSMSVECARPSPVSALKETVLDSVLNCLVIAEQGGIPISDLNNVIQDVIKNLLRLEESITPSTPIESRMEPMASSAVQTKSNVTSVQPITPTVQTTPIQTTSNQLAGISPISSLNSVSTAAQLPSTSGTYCKDCCLENQCFYCILNDRNA